MAGTKLLVSDPDAKSYRRYRILLPMEATGRPEAKVPEPEERGYPRDDHLYQLFVRLDGIEPLIWRRLLVSKADRSAAPPPDSARADGLARLPPAPIRSW